MTKTTLVTLRQKQILKRLVNLFEKYKIHYVVSGGLASIIYGASNRKLFDIDVVTNKKGLQKIIKLLRAYKVKDNDRKDLDLFEVDSTSFASFNIEGVLLDIGDGESAFLTSSKGRFKFPVKLRDGKEVNFAGFNFRVRPFEEMIIQKFILDRQIDRKDLREMIEKTKIDIQYLEQRAKETGIWGELKGLIK